MHWRYSKCCCYCKNFPLGILSQKESWATPKPELCICRSSSPSGFPHQILSIKDFHRCTLWYFIRLSHTSGPLTKNPSTTADPHWEFFHYSPHACHQQITKIQKRVTKNCFSDGITNSYCSFLPHTHNCSFLEKQLKKLKHIFHC